MELEVSETKGGGDTGQRETKAGKDAGPTDSPLTREKHLNEEKQR